MYNAKHYDGLKFRNQSWLKLAKLYMKYYKYGDFNDCMNNLSETDRDMYKQHPLNQLIGRIDDDKYLQYQLKPAGTDNINTCDINKSRTSALYLKTTPWIICNAMDTWEDFDVNNSSHLEIPLGEYILRAGAYGNEKIPIKYTSGLYSYNMIRNLLEKKYITFNDILQIKVVKHYLKADYFKEFVESLISKCPDDYKIIINTFIGGLHQPVYKSYDGYYDKSLEVALALNNFYNSKNNCRSTINTDIDNEMYYVVVQQETPNYITGTCLSRQVLEIEQINLENIALCCIFNTPRAICISANTDCFTVINANPDYINKCKAITDNDNVISLLGTVKIEEFIKVKGRYFDDVNEVNDVVIVYKPPEITII